MVPKDGKKTFCDACECFVFGCVRARNDSPACHYHKKVVESWGPTMRNAWHFRSLAPAMIPCDITVLGKIWERVRACSVLQTLVFLIKEPILVVQAACLGEEVPRPFGAEQHLGEVLRPLVMFINGRGARKEHESLNEQGVQHVFSFLQGRGKTAGRCRQCGHSAA